MVDIKATLSRYPDATLTDLSYKYFSQEQNRRLLRDIIRCRYEAWESSFRKELDPVDLELAGWDRATLDWLIRLPAFWHQHHQEAYMSLFEELQQDGSTQGEKYGSRLKQCLAHTGLGLSPELYNYYKSTQDRKEYIDLTLLYLIGLKRLSEGKAIPWDPANIPADRPYNDFVPALYKYSLEKPRAAIHLLAEMLNAPVEQPEAFELEYARVYLLRAFKALEQHLSADILRQVRKVNEFLLDWARELMDSVLNHPALEGLNQQLQKISGQAIDEKMEKPEVTMDSIDHFITEN